MVTTLNGNDSFNILGKLFIQTPSINVYGHGGNDFLFGAIWGGFDICNISDCNHHSIVASSTLYGGDGNDAILSFYFSQLEGGAGADLLFDLSGLLGSYYSAALYVSSPDGVTVDLALGTGSGGDAEGDKLVGINGLVGSAFDDVVIGNLWNNYLEGGAGNDSLDGGWGADTLKGGTGNDSLDGGSGADTLSGDEGNDSLGGGSGRDNLSGGAGTDSLDGGSGADTLSGGDGNDTLQGGAGADRFAYFWVDQSSPSNLDQILDFSVSQGDRIVLTGFDGISYDNISFVKGDIDGDSVSDDLQVLVDLDGVAANDLEIDLINVNVASLASTSFMFFL